MSLPADHLLVQAGELLSPQQSTLPHSLYLPSISLMPSPEEQAGELYPTCISAVITRTSLVSPLYLLTLPYISTLTLPYISPSISSIPLLYIREQAGGLYLPCISLPTFSCRRPQPPSAIAPSTLAAPPR